MAEAIKKHSILSKNISFLRKERSLSQGELAEILGLNRGNIASYENGTAEPNLKNVQKLTEYFNIKFEKLMSADLRMLSENAEKEVVIDKELRTPDQIEEQAAKILEMLKGLVIYNQYKVESLDTVSPEYSRLLADYIDLATIGSELATFNIELANSIRQSIK